MQANNTTLAAAISLGLGLTAAFVVRGQDGEGGDPRRADQPVEAAADLAFDDAFWARWSDGRAELAGYALRFPRYGEVREGTAVAIFVKEDLLEAERVKADAGPGPGTFPVMKLNLVQDFPTGLYDYNLMTSVFVGLQPSGGRPAGDAAKVSFSSQEWCGHVYHQVLLDADRVREDLHSYFESEGDREGSLERPADGLSEDALLHWARGMARPALAPGEAREVTLLRSLERARLRHRPLAWSAATLRREAGTRTVEVPAGAFEVEVRRAELADGPTWTFFVEAGGARRLVRWERSDGLEAELLASERLPYWRLHGPTGARHLEALGLERRPPRTP